jgi:hypothetical protein
LSDYIVPPATNGTLTFYGNGTPIGTTAVNGNRTTNFPISNVSAGTRTYTLAYSGDTNYVLGTHGCSTGSSMACGVAPALPQV